MTARGELALRRGLLLVVAVTAVTAVLAGLARLGLDAGWGAGQAVAHGPLLVLGVFATLIGLERAVAVGARWSYAAPVLGAAGAGAMLAAVPWAPWIAAASTLALVAINVAVVRRQAAAFTWLMLLGSLVLAAGAGGWALGQPVFAVVPAWMAFLVLTIVAERLELSRLAPTPRWASRAVVALAAIVAVAAVTLRLDAGPGRVVLGVAAALLAGWQLRFDIARRTLRRRGLPRFAATGVLLGSKWLLVAGLLLVFLGLPAAGPHRDAVVHAVMVGFVLSMVFAHAPIILPAVARIAVPFHPVLYAPLAVLHLGLCARVVGDLIGDPVARQLGAVGNALALPMFVGAVLWARSAARRGALRVGDVRAPAATHR